MEWTITLGRFGTKTSEHEYDRLIGEWLVNGRQLHDDEIKSISITELCIDYTIRSKAYYRKNGKLTRGIRKREVRNEGATSRLRKDARYRIRANSLQVIS